MVRLDQVNTFLYKGYIVKMSEPKEIIKDSRVYIYCSIEVEYRDNSGRKANIIMSIPRSFNAKAIEKLIKYRTSALFRFCIYVHGEEEHRHNVILCMSIEPFSPRAKNLRQEVIYDPYKKKLKNNGQTVDKDGYVFPYNY